MSTPDYATLARQFMDMWQQQMHQAMTEPGFVHAMMDGMKQEPHAQKAKAYEPKEPYKQPAPSSESSDEQLDALQGRIRDLEKRVNELEKQLAAVSVKTKPKNPIRKRAVKPDEKPKRKAAAKKPAGRAKATAAKRKPAAKPRGKKR